MDSVVIFPPTFKLASKGRLAEGLLLSTSHMEIRGSLMFTSSAVNRDIVKMDSDHT
jgi:hypothetical protein